MADQSEEFRSVICAAVKEYIAAKSIEADSPKTGVGNISNVILACGASLLTAFGVYKKRK